MSSSSWSAVIIGAGQSGLGVSYFLKQLGVNHRLLERGRVGECWRSQRWDSFRMNTPNVLTVMPGGLRPGWDPEGFMTRSEFLDLLEGFASTNGLQVETEKPVIELSRDEERLYRLRTRDEVILARNVVLATGSQNHPITPAYADAIPKRVQQLHAADYRNPGQLPRGSVLVVGTASSGLQIAEDLLDAGRDVYVGTSGAGRIPRRYRGRDFSLWRLESGFLGQLPDHPVGIAPRPVPLQLSASPSLSLATLSQRGAILLGHLTGVRGGSLTFADDVQRNLASNEAGAAAARALVDAYISRSGRLAGADEPDPAEAAAAIVPSPPILELDPERVGLGCVIWCTGFTYDFSWVDLPILGPNGAPAHDRGESTTCPGIFFVGLPLQSARKSTLVLGVEDDARWIASRVAVRC
jgi:putative flavoprotein involved in K+ transport